MLLGNTPRSRRGFAYGTVTRYGQTFQTLPLATRFVTPRQRGSTDQTVPLPRITQRLPAITRMTGLASSPFAHHYSAESLLLSLPAGTEMFHFPALPPAALCIQAGATAHDGRRVSPFGNPRITARLPAPRGLSQAPTSFIGSWYQDIHRVLLKTWHYNALHSKTPRTPRKGIARIRCSRPLCSSQDTDGTTPPVPASGDHVTRPFESAPMQKRLLPQDPTACPASPAFACASFRSPREGERTNRASRATS